MPDFKPWDTEETMDVLSKPPLDAFNCAIAIDDLPIDSKSNLYIVRHAVSSSLRGNQSISTSTKSSSTRRPMSSGPCPDQEANMRITRSLMTTIVIPSPFSLSFDSSPTFSFHRQHSFLRYFHVAFELLFAM